MRIQAGSGYTGFRDYYYQAYANKRRAQGHDRLIIPGSIRERMVQQSHQEPPLTLSNGLTGDGPRLTRLSGPHGFYYAVLHQDAPDGANYRLPPWLQQFDQSKPAIGVPVGWPIEYAAISERMTSFRADSELTDDEKFIQDSGAASPRAREIIDAARDMTKLGLEFQVIPTSEEKAADRQEAAIAENRRNRPIIPENRTSIGGPSSISGPAAVSQATFTDGPLNSVSGPPNPLNRRLDTLGQVEGTGDQDGPFRSVESRNSHLNLEAVANAPLNRPWGIQPTDYQTMDARWMEYNRHLAEQDRAADTQSMLYNLSLAAQDEAWVLQNWAEDRAMAENASEFSSELALANQKAADVEYYRHQWELAVDIGAAYEYSRSIDASGLAETGVPPNVIQDELPASAPVTRLENAEPADALRSSSEELSSSGVYPLDRPADAISAPAVPEVAPTQYSQSLSPAEAAPQPTSDAASASGSQPEPDAVLRPIDNLGLNSMALAPLSIGISFTV